MGAARITQGLGLVIVTADSNGIEGKKGRSGRATTARFGKEARRRVIGDALAADQNGRGRDWHEEHN